MNQSANHKNNCLICGAEIVYSQAQERECVFCHQRFTAEAHCVNGHYICDTCHSKPALPWIKEYCLRSQSQDPIAIAIDLMRHPSIHMHGPEHHVLIPSALLTAYHNAGGQLDLATALVQAAKRGQQVPGGICGLWGCCGAGIGAGIFFSIATKDTPLAGEIWGQGNLLTSRCLNAIAQSGGPRCCKRDGYQAILTAIDYTAEKLGVTMKKPQKIHCSFSHLNQECLKNRCPFFPQ